MFMFSLKFLSCWKPSLYSINAFYNFVISKDKIELKVPVFKQTLLGPRFFSSMSFKNPLLQSHVYDDSLKPPWSREGSSLRSVMFSIVFCVTVIQEYIFSNLTQPLAAKLLLWGEVYFWNAVVKHFIVIIIYLERRKGVDFLKKIHYPKIGSSQWAITCQCGSILLKHSQSSSVLNR